MRLDAEQFAIDCAKRGIPLKYWPDGLAAAESLKLADDDSEESTDDDS